MFATASSFKTMNPYFWQLCWYSQGELPSIHTLEELKVFILGFYSNNDALSDPELIKTLFELRARKIKSGVLDREFTLSEGSLRCYISHFIRYVCISLEDRYRKRHSVYASDLYPLVLLDTPDQLLGRNRQKDTKFMPLSLKVINRFEPERGELKSWTYKLTQQEDELSQYLRECGVLRITDWALLNGATVSSLRGVLVKSPGIQSPVSPAELELAEGLLACYHDVYRRDRIQSLSGNRRRTCEPPSEDQLHRIARELEHRMSRTLSGQEVKEKLLKLAEAIRKCKLAQKGGRVEVISYDKPLEEDGSESILDMISSSEPSDNDREQDLFYEENRAQFIADARVAVRQVLEQWTEQRQKKGEHLQFMKGLLFFHCEGRSMGDFAAELGMNNQVKVTRLLKLKELRSDVGQKLLELNAESTRHLASQYLDPELLLKRYEAILAALSEHIKSFIAEAEAEASIPNNRTTDSLFARLLCEYLDTLLKL
jgi:hypothetical protein